MNSRNEQRRVATICRDLSFNSQGQPSKYTLVQARRATKSARKAQEKQARRG